MIYLPDDFLIDKANKEKVFAILQKLDNDVLADALENILADVKDELKTLGETTVIEKLDNGFFHFGS